MAIRVTCDGALGRIAAESFIGILDHSLNVLQDLDRRITEEPKGTLKWVISGLGDTFSSYIEIATLLLRGNTDQSPRIIEGFTQGLRHIQMVGTTPPYFSEENVRDVLKIVQEMNRDGVVGVHYMPTEQQDKGASILPKDGEEIKKLVGVRYRALGAVEGQIEVVSIRKRRRHFSITHSRTLRSIRCSFPEAVESSVFEAMEGRRRVIVTGLIGYNAKHEPISIEVQKELRFLGREHELPSIEDLAGSDPDLTGSLSTEEYIRSLRDG